MEVDKRDYRTYGDIVMLSLILVDIRSVHNVGSIFRTADATGVTKLYLVGITPAPLDRFGRKRDDLAKAALGAEEAVKWEQIAGNDVEALLKRLKQDGRELLALEQSKNSVPYDSHKPEGNAVLVIGNEVEGLSRAILELCDKTLEIPVHGSKESLNVSVATGIALYELIR